MKSFVISFITALVVSIIICVLIFSEIINLKKILPEDMFAEKAVDTRVIIPNMLNLKIDEAQKVADELGIKLIIEEEFIETVQSDIVIKQFPLPGFKAEKGDAVSLTVSKEMEISLEIMSEADLMEMEEFELTPTITMPDVTGLNAETAVELLNKTGITNISENYAEDDVIEKGKVVSFNPPAGTEMDESAIVDLVISKGPSIEMVIVPNLFNKTLAAAKDEIRRSNLKLGKINEVIDVEYGFDRIIGQSIKWGDKVKEGTVIDINLNKESEEEETIGW